MFLLCGCGHHLCAHHALLTIQTWCSVWEGTARELEVTKTRELRPTLEQSVWAILDDDEFHGVPECV